MIPHNRFTLDAMLPALSACEAQGVRNVVFTMWGDDGAECSHFSQLPALYYLGQYAKGNRDEEKIKAGFEKLIGIPFDDFMAIDTPNEVRGYQKKNCNPSKYMLYSDYFNDYLDYTICEGDGAKYEGYAEKLHAIAKTSRKYGYVFDSAAKLCDVLAIKYELGLRTRNAYEAGDKERLQSLAQNEYVKVEKLLDVFARSFEKQWFKDNKPHGFDVQDHRLGALIRRTQSCRRRIIDYVNGKIDRIDELEETLLPYKEKGESFVLNGAIKTSTVNLPFFGAVL